MRVYSPTVAEPAFAPQGELVGVPSLPFPFGRGEYRFPLALSPRVRRDLRAFQPNVVHVSSPDGRLLGRVVLETLVSLDPWMPPRKVLKIIEELQKEGRL